MCAARRSRARARTCGSCSCSAVLRGRCEGRTAALKKGPRCRESSRGGPFLTDGEVGRVDPSQVVVTRALMTDGGSRSIDPSQVHRIRASVTDGRGRSTDPSQLHGPPAPPAITQTAEGARPASLSLHFRQPREPDPRRSTPKPECGPVRRAGCGASAIPCRLRWRACSRRSRHCRPTPRWASRAGRSDRRRSNPAGCSADAP
jgi:hypothetical protein